MKQCWPAVLLGKLCGVARGICNFSSLLLSSILCVGSGIRALILFLAILAPCPSRHFGGKYFPLDLVPPYPPEVFFQFDVT